MLGKRKHGYWSYFAIILPLSLYGCGFGGGGGSASSASAGVSDPDAPIGSGDIPETPDEDIPVDSGVAQPFDYGASFNQQDGPGAFTITPSSVNGQINWEQFPIFDLVPGHSSIYAGPYPGDTSTIPALTHGFTHCQSGPTEATRSAVPVSRRAILWTSSAGPAGQPWVDIESPWNNSVPALQAKWSSYLKGYANLYTDSKGNPVPSVDILVSDMERVRGSDSKILELKGHPSVPANINALSDGDFIDLYKRDMGAIHQSAHQFAVDQGFTGKIGSYGITPIVRTWWGIDDYTWDDWTNSTSHLFFLLMNYLGGSNWLEEFGTFYQNCQVMPTSAYVFYDYPASKAANPSQWNNAADYLAYVLFQAEVNLQWAPDKEQLLFLWLRYHDGSGAAWAGKPIRNHMAHALGIFPFLTGIKGVWLWDHYEAGQVPLTNFQAYEYFIYGLYRLSLHASIFEGTTIPYSNYNARTLMVNNFIVIRGVENPAQKKLLVAVHDPYQDINEEKIVPIYRNAIYLGSVTLHGLEVALEEFDTDPVITCVGDFTNNGVIDGGDLALLLLAMGQTGPDLPMDLNHDGIIDSADQTILESLFGTCP